MSYCMLTTRCLSYTLFTDTYARIHLQGAKATELDGIKTYDFEGKEREIEGSESLT